MDSTLLIVIICASVVVAIGLLILLVHRANKKSAEKLQQNINKYKKLSQQVEINSKVTLPTEEKIETAKEEIPNKEEISNKEETLNEVNSVEEANTNPFIEEYVDEDVYTNFQRDYIKNKILSANKNRAVQQEKTYSSQDDFEEFLNEHSYSRKIINQDIIANLKDLSPEIKAVIISNLFSRPDDWNK